MNSSIFNVECISSKSNPLVSKISKLLTKKGRYEYNLFTLDGIKLFEEAVKYSVNIKYIIVKENAVFSEEIIEMVKMCKRNNVQILCLSDSAFSKLTEENSPQGIITVCEFLKNIVFLDDTNEFKNGEKMIILESLRDPGNMGTILRNATAFNFDSVILSSDCVDVYSPKVIRASMGAIFKTRIIISCDLVKIVEKIKSKGRRVIPLTLDNDSLVLGKDKICKEDVFVVGNEGHGISKPIIEATNNTMIIPMQKNTESLNAAVAATIIMWELFK